MNERIRQFEVESHIDVYALGKDRAKWESVLEKFAQLIVKESIEVMIKNDYHGEWLGEKVKEHFGVE